MAHSDLGFRGASLLLVSQEGYSLFLEIALCAWRANYGVCRISRHPVSPGALRDDDVR